MAETEWRGTLRLSLVSCPVRLAPASRDASEIRLVPLNGRTGNPVVEGFVDAHTGDVVPTEVVIRGYQRPDAGYVTIANAELEALAGPADLIDLVHFCPAGQIDRNRIERHYDIHPDGPLAADALASLRLAMQRCGCEGVAYVRLGEHERQALVGVRGPGLMLAVLRPAGLSAPPERGAPDADVPDEMVEVAEGMIRRRLFDGDPNLVADRYQQRLRALIAEKTGGALPPADAIFEPAPGEFDLDAFPPAAAPVRGRELATEILLHVIGVGDRRFIEPGWAGSPGSRQQVEAISIRPRDELEPAAIELRVFAQDGRATAWVSDGSYAGTRDCGLPLTGFAVRPAPELRDRLDIVYEGCFADGGVIGPKSNGETCASPIDNDPLEAVRVIIAERPEGA